MKVNFALCRVRCYIYPIMQFFNYNINSAGASGHCCNHLQGSKPDILYFDALLCANVYNDSMLSSLIFWPRSVLHTCT